jgi:hypothetical protein
MTHQLNRTIQHKIIYSVMLLGALVIAVEAIYGCGVKTATGTLLIGAVIVLAGLLLHPWIGMIAAIIAGTAIISVRDQDILLSCAIFVLLSCIPWWFFKRIHDMEARTGYAEIALLRQKFNLKRCYICTILRNLAYLALYYYMTWQII